MTADRLVPRYGAEPVPGPYAPSGYPTGEPAPARRVESRHVVDAPRSVAAALPDLIAATRGMLEQHVRPGLAGLALHMLVGLHLAIAEAFARQLAALHEGEA